MYDVLAGVVAFACVARRILCFAPFYVQAGRGAPVGVLRRSLESAGDKLTVIQGPGFARIRPGSPDHQRSRPNA